VRAIAEVDSLRNEVRNLQQQVDLLKASWHVDRSSKKAIYAFIVTNQQLYSVEMMCTVFEVQRSGFYAWVGRPASLHEETDAELMAEIERIFEESHATYGSPRVHAELISLGWKVARKRVARLMRKLGLSAIVPRRFVKTTLSQHDGRIAPNLLAQNFTVPSVNRVWVADLTYVWTDEGWLYLSVFVDLYSRRVVGWAAASHMRDDLVLDSLHDAFSRRGSELTTSRLMIHTDRGSQYASDDFIGTLDRRKIVRSMSATGCCFDNAVAESFFATLKKELVYRMHFRTRSEAVDAMTVYIDRFYNCIRRHSTNEYVSPRTREGM
jgi:transposase InsO family protein